MKKLALGLVAALLLIPVAGFFLPCPNTPTCHCSSEACAAPSKCRCPMKTCREAPRAPVRALLVSAPASPSRSHSFAPAAAKIGDSFSRVPEALAGGADGPVPRASPHLHLTFGVLRI